MSDDLELRLRSADPVKRDPLDQPTLDSVWLRERVDGTVRISRDLNAGSAGARRWKVMAVAAAAVLLAGVGVSTMFGDGDSPGRQPVAQAPMELALAPDGISSASCLPFAVDTLAGMPVAFSGTVVKKDAEQVLIDVDRWYQGGDTKQVRLNAPEMSKTSLGGIITFEKDQRYLLTAAEDDVVNYCGYSARWSQKTANDYKAAFDAG